MASTTTRTAGRLRRLPAPACEPPFDDERPDAPAPATGWLQGSLALSYQLPGGVPARPEPPAQLRLVLDATVATAEPGPSGAEEDDDEESDAFGQRLPTPRADLPEPRRWSARLGQGLVEVLSGHRPAQQLLRWTDEVVYARLLRATRALGRRPVGDRARSPRPALRVVRVCEPDDGVVEACAVVAYGQRCRALAFRLEGLDGRWRCTAFDLL